MHQRPLLQTKKINKDYSTLPPCFLGVLREGIERYTTLVIDIIECKHKYILFS